jgi:hypothetical protein
MVIEGVIDIEEASKLLEFVKEMTPEVEEGIVEKMVGKFKGIIPEGKSSVEYLKELRHNIQLVQIQPEERLAATSELNPASSLVTGCGEARGMGYWAATQVKGLSHEVFIVPETLSF